MLSAKKTLPLPEGYLGVKLGKNFGRPVVIEVAPDSRLNGKLFEGDYVVSLDVDGVRYDDLPLSLLLELLKSTEQTPFRSLTVVETKSRKNQAGSAKNQARVKMIHTDLAHLDGESVELQNLKAIILKHNATFWFSEDKGKFFKLYQESLEKIPAAVNALPAEVTSGKPDLTTYLANIVTLANLQLKALGTILDDKNASLKAELEKDFSAIAEKITTELAAQNKKRIERSGSSVQKTDTVKSTDSNRLTDEYLPEYMNMMIIAQLLSHLDGKTNIPRGWSFKKRFFRINKEHKKQFSDGGGANAFITYKAFHKVLKVKANWGWDYNFVGVYNDAKDNLSLAKADEDPLKVLAEKYGADSWPKDCLIPKEDAASGAVCEEVTVKEWIDDKQQDVTKEFEQGRRIMYQFIIPFSEESPYFQQAREWTKDYQGVRIPEGWESGAYPGDVAKGKVAPWKALLGKTSGGVSEGVMKQMSMGTLASEINGDKPKIIIKKITFKQDQAGKWTVQEQRVIFNYKMITDSKGEMSDLKEQEWDEKVLS